MIVRDRICEECGERFQPPIPRWAGPLMLAAGGALITGALGLIVYFIISDDPAKWRNGGAVAMLVSLLLTLGGGVVAAGWKIIRGEDPDNRIF